MFVKKKRNRSGSTIVVVVSKDRGRYRYIKVIGTSSGAGAISSYMAEGRRYISEHTILFLLLIFSPLSKLAKQELSI